MPFVNESLLSPNVAALVGIAALMAKVICFIFLFMWVRWTIPRFRYDQLMHLGWRILIPLALFNVVTVLFVLVPVPYKYILNLVDSTPLSCPLAEAKNKI